MKAGICSQSASALETDCEGVVENITLLLGLPVRACLFSVGFRTARLEGEHEERLKCRTVQARTVRRVSIIA